jgi:hypothetical protein
MNIASGCFMRANLSRRALSCLSSQILSVYLSPATTNNSLRADTPNNLACPVTARYPEGRIGAIFSWLCALEGTSTMLRKAISLIALVYVLAIGQALADTLVVDGIDAGQSTGHPARGATKASVQSEWGEPRGRQGPIGEPPISRWEYEQFIVFFERDRVLHTVAKR